MMKLKQLLQPQIVITIMLMILLTLPFIFSDLDLTIQNWFYQSGWMVGEQQPWAWLYHYGTLPGLTLAVFGLFLLAGSWIWPKLRQQRRLGALIVLTLVIGPGLLVNVLGKGYWGRPRPREIIQFQGQVPFQRIHQPGTPGQGKSFPCGHASVGFFLMVMAFGQRKYRWIWFGTGLSYGTLMGIARIAQGAHFASDVIWAGGLTYLTAAVLDQVLRPRAPDSAPVAATSPLKKLISTSALLSGLLLVILFFLVATPYYKKWQKKLPATSAITHVQLQLPAVNESIRILQREQPEALVVLIELQGFGFPKLNLEAQVQAVNKGNTLTVTTDYELTGLITERTGQISYFIQSGLYLQLTQDDLTSPLTIGQADYPSRIETLHLNRLTQPVALTLAPGSQIRDRIDLQSESSLIQLTMTDILDPGRHLWRVGADGGNVDLVVTQNIRPRQPIKINAWSNTGHLHSTNTIGTACGLNINWDDGQGQSLVIAKGRWEQQSRQLLGPVGIITVHFNQYLRTKTGQITIKVNRGEGDNQVTVPTVTPTSQGPSHFIELDAEENLSRPARPLMIEPTLQPTPRPAWIDQELQGLSFE